jgi:surface protein
MSGFFMAAGATNPEFDLNIADLDTSNVTNMKYMFSSTGASNTSLTLDFSKFDTSNVINMSSMFSRFCEGCQSFIIDLKYFDTSKVEDISYMFDSMGISSQNYDITMTITNPNLKKYDFVFHDVAQFDNTRLLINYTNETSNIVDEMLKTRVYGAHVYKGKNIDSEYKIEIVSGTGTNTGDEIKIANEHFYVMFSNEKETILMSKYNLEVGNECEVDLAHNTHSCIEIPNPSGIQNPKAKGALLDENFKNVIEDYGAITFSSNNYWSEYYGSNYPRYVYSYFYSSDIIVPLSNYTSYLNDSGLLVLDNRPISIEELIELGCDASNATCLTSPYEWLYSTTYWTGSASDSYALYTVYNVGYVLSAGYDVDHGGGIRPVITIPTSEITK